MLELLSLLQTGRRWPAADLAARLGVSARTLRRDLDRLRDLGYPVASARGPGGSYQLVAGQAMPPLLLTDDEAVATVVGLRFAALTHADGDTGAADNALRKLEQVLPGRLRHRVRAVAASIETGSRPEQGLDLRTLRLLGTAAHSHQHVRFDYTSRTGQRSERRVEPYRQVLFGRRWYLLGWDRDRADWRTFRLDRISGLTVPGTTFAPRELPESGAVSFVQDSARYPITRRQGVVRFAAPVEVVSARLIPQAGTLEAVDEHTCRYVTAPDSWEWLAIVLAMVGVPYTIEGPAELIAYSRQLADRIARATSHPPV
ncbi:putative DNA-binding transcriptional regulator YafY, contains an HTH and WYL domains [Goodfellowiella coeruleoviolacea]|uniref:DNA-binding transcriptional regulator YafY, contains an HTH and WYL domains n=2 Tax=Goodfellowiella coeruleoviolacea TaxID=334858 RepID=A0AAE3GC28_9PSEU|nr:putative DNA-binding transcriptional regulator YafY, contains an HTH and WYL domains [Goodfellowiella coeruleoviolacea]